MRVGPEQQPLTEFLGDRTFKQQGDTQHLKESIAFGPVMRAAPNASELAPMTALWVGIDLPTVEPARMIVQHSDGQRGALLNAINQATAKPFIDPAARQMARDKLESAEMQPNYLLDEGDRLFGLWLLEGHVYSDPCADSMVRALNRLIVDKSNTPPQVMQRLCNKLGGNGRYTEPHRELMYLPGVRRFDVNLGTVARFDVTATRLHGNRVTFDALNEWSRS